MTENNRKRNFLKTLIIGALAVVVTGGVGAYAYDKYETSQRAKIQEAYSNVILHFVHFVECYYYYYYYEHLGRREM